MTDPLPQDSNSLIYQSPAGDDNNKLENKRPQETRQHQQQQPEQELGAFDDGEPEGELPQQKIEEDLEQQEHQHQQQPQREQEQEQEQSHQLPHEQSHQQHQQLSQQTAYSPLQYTESEQLPHQQAQRSHHESAQIQSTSHGQLTLSSPHASPAYDFGNTEYQEFQDTGSGVSHRQATYELGQFLPVHVITNSSTSCSDRETNEYIDASPSHPKNEDHPFRFPPTPPLAASASKARPTYQENMLQTTHIPVYQQHQQNSSLAHTQMHQYSSIPSSPLVQEGISRLSLPHPPSLPASQPHSSGSRSQHRSSPALLSQPIQQYLQMPGPQAQSQSSYPRSSRPTISRQVQIFPPRQHSQFQIQRQQQQLPAQSLSEISLSEENDHQPLMVSTSSMQVAQPPPQQPPVQSQLSSSQYMSMPLGMPGAPPPPSSQPFSYVPQYAAIGPIHREGGVRKERRKRTGSKRSLEEMILDSQFTTNITGISGAGAAAGPSNRGPQICLMTSTSGLMSPSILPSDPTVIPLNVCEPPLATATPFNPAALQPEHTPKSKKKSKYTKDQDDTILRMKKEGRTWAEIAEAAKCGNAIAARNRYQVLIGQQGGGTVSWEEQDVIELQKLLEYGEKAKWEMIANELTKQKDKSISAEACRKKVKELFDQDPLQFGISIGNGTMNAAFPSSLGPAPSAPSSTMPMALDFQQMPPSSSLGPLTSSFMSMSPGHLPVPGPSHAPPAFASGPPPLRSLPPSGVIGPSTALSHIRGPSAPSASSSLVSSSSNVSNKPTKALTYVPPVLQTYGPSSDYPPHPRPPDPSAPQS